MRASKIGNIYGRLTVIEDSGVRQACPSRRNRVYLCRCECGGTKEVPTSLLGKSTNSCGCLVGDSKRKPLTIGARCGRLVILSLSPQEKDRKLRYLCRCDCGREKIITASNLTNGSTRSCGCLRGETAAQRTAQSRKNMLVEGTNLGRIRSTKSSSNNFSGVRGVSWHKGQGQWRARISFKGVTHSLGYYDSLDEAAAVRKKAEDEIFGEFLRQRGQAKKEAKDG